MKLLAVLPADARPERIDIAGWYRRKAARAVLVSERGEVALLHVPNEGYYKLPGGGLEGDEQAKHALVREMLEETGCKAAIKRPLGRVDEYIASEQMFQSSYCYLAQVVGEPGEPAFTEDELADGFELVWVPSLQAALETVEGARPEGREGQRIRERDVRVLRAALASA